MTVGLLSFAGSSNAGWTNFVQTTGAIIYVSDSDGNDSNNGLSSIANPSNIGGVGAAGPKKTIAAGIALLTNGQPDWLLLKEGDTFTDQDFTTFGGHGLSGTGYGPTFSGEPMIISSYHPSRPGVIHPTVSARPLILDNHVASVTGANINLISGSAGFYVAVVGLVFYAYKRDPLNGGYAGQNTSSHWGGIVGTTSTPWFLIEDCCFNYFAGNSYSSSASGQGEVYLYRSAFLNSYAQDTAHSQGWFCDRTTTFVVDTCVFDSNGGNQTIPRGVGDFLSHNLYVGYDETTDSSLMGVPVLKNSITNNPNFYGYKCMPGGTITNNYFGNFCAAGYVSDTALTVQKNVSDVSHNVFTKGRDDRDGGASGSDAQGFQFNTQAINSTATANIVLHSSQAWNGVNWSFLAGASNLSMTGNYFADFPLGVGTLVSTDPGTGEPAAAAVYAFSSRPGLDLTGSTAHAAAPANTTIEDYDASLGGPGTEAHFIGNGSNGVGQLSGASGNCKFNWNPAYTAPAINNWFRGKVGLASYP